MEDDSFSIRVIVEYGGTKVYTIETRCETYGDVMRELEKEGVKTNEIQLCNAKLDAPAFARFHDSEEIEWGDLKAIELYAYEREYPVRVTTFRDTGVSSTEQTETFNLLKGATIQDVRAHFEAKFGNDELKGVPLHYRNKLEDSDTLESLGEQFLDNPVLIGKISVNVADESCNQMRHLAALPSSTVKELQKQFMENCSPPRVLHKRGDGTRGGKVQHLCTNCDAAYCLHSWLYFNGKVLSADQMLQAALQLQPEDIQKIVYYAAPPFTVTIKEKNEKNELIETKIEIEDSNTILDVRNKYSRNAEEGLVDGDLLFLDDVELKEERLVYSYAIANNSALFVTKRSANQPTFVYTCADCGNDLRLRKDEKIRCRECGHRVVYKPRLNKPLQHFAR